MVQDMEQRIYRLVRAGGIDTNPALSMQRAGTFAAAVTEYGTATLHLEPYHVFLRSHVEQRRQSAFMARLPNFEADTAGYAATQGYDSSTPAPYPAGPAAGTVSNLKGTR